MFLNFWPSLAIIGLDWPFWPLIAFNDFSRLREVFMGINQVNMTTFHPSDFKNDYHARFAKAVQSEIQTQTEGSSIRDLSCPTAQGSMALQLLRPLW